MALRRAAGTFLAILGGLMIAVWGVLLATDQVPEVRTAPVALTFLLVAEMTTATLSMVSGAALVAQKPWAGRAYLVASGMMLYAITNYIGVLAQGGQTLMFFVFCGFLALTIAFLVGTSRRREPASVG